jgi:hypothetical protein
MSTEPRWTTSSGAARWPPQPQPQTSGGKALDAAARPQSAAAERRTKGRVPAHSAVWGQPADATDVMHGYRRDWPVSAADVMHGYRQDWRAPVPVAPTPAWQRVARSTPQPPPHTLVKKPTGRAAARLVGFPSHPKGTPRTTSWYRDRAIEGAELTVVRKPPGCVVCPEHPHAHVQSRGTPRSR